MVLQGILFRTLNMGLCNSRLLLTNRVTPVVIHQPTMSLKQETVERLKKLNVPEKPKRPLNPYLRFVQVHRPALVKEHPDWKVTQVIKQCAVDWQKAHTSIKEKYELEWKHDLAEFDQKLAKYNASLTKEQIAVLKEVAHETREDKEKRRVRKERRSLNKPKRPIAAYMLYIMEESKILNKPPVQLMSELKETWKALPEHEKKKYFDTYATNKAQYEKDLKAWEIKMLAQGHENVVRSNTIRQSRPLKRSNKSKGE